jgi:hypothetical protein
MKPRYWSLAIVLFLINYIIFATLFTMLFEGDFNSSYATRTPEPTFTPAPAQPIIVVPTPVPIIPEPTPTATRVVQSESNAGQGISTIEEIIQAGSAQPDLEQTNKPQAAILYTDASAAIPTTSNYQYKPIGWYGDNNAKLTRFSGEIRDMSDAPVSGISVQARCGDYSVVSKPSGSTQGENENWPPGYYEIMIDTKPVPCIWFLTLIDTDDGHTIKAVLSESIPVEVTDEKSVITAHWQRQ